MVTVDYMVIADAAVVAEGKHYIHGAGWDHIMAAAFPVRHPALAVAVRLAIPWGDTNQPHMLELDLLDQDGNSILPPPGALRGPINVGRPPQAHPGSDLYVPLVFNLAGVEFPQPATYSIVLRIEGVDAKRSTLHVSMLPGMPGPQGQR